jgi:protein-disulfide reductase (glutathione)
MHDTSLRRLALALALLVAGATLTAVRAHAGGDWNEAQIDWKSYEDGMALAKKERKPVCLIFYTEWCPHCRNYSGVFHDPKVVERSKQFVMIRLDKDKNREISAKYVPDGEYIPRTYFLTADGVLDPEIHAPRAEYKYFYDEMQPGGVLNGMDQALKKMKRS